MLSLTLLATSLPQGRCEFTLESVKALNFARLQQCAVQAAAPCVSRAGERDGGAVNIQPPQLFQYRDEEGDLVDIACERDLVECIVVMEVTTNRALCVEVVDPEWHSQLTAAGTTHTTCRGVWI